MGCSSTKAPLPPSPNAISEVPKEEIKEDAKSVAETNGRTVSLGQSMLFSDGEEKENVPVVNDSIVSNVHQKEGIGSRPMKRKASLSPSILTDDVVIDIEETEEQAEKDITLLNSMVGTENSMDDKSLIRVLVPVHSTYRNLLQNKYREKFSKVLLHEVISKGPPACKALFEKLFLPPEEYLAVWLHQLVKTGNLLLIVELLTAWPPSTVIDVKRSYAQEYKVSFEEDLKNSLDDQTSPTVKVIVLSLATLQRIDDTREVDSEVAFYESDELSKGRDQIIEILTQKSYSRLQLASIFKEYKEKYYLDIRDSIDIEFQDDAQKILTAVVDISEKPSVYLALELQEVFQGAKLQTDRLLFLLIGRCEIDLSDIHKKYFHLNAKTFQEEIKNKYSGLIKYALLLLASRFGGSVE